MNPQSATIVFFRRPSQEIRNALIHQVLMVLLIPHTEGACTMLALVRSMMHDDNPDARVSAVALIQDLFLWDGLRIGRKQP